VSPQSKQGIIGRPIAYFLKYVQAASANKTIVTIQRVEPLNPVFLAMSQS